MNPSAIILGLALLCVEGATGLVVGAPMPTLGAVEVPKPLATNAVPIVVTNRTLCLVHGLTLKVTKVRSDVLQINRTGSPGEDWYERTTVQDLACPKRLCPVHFTETNRTVIARADLPAFLKKLKPK